MHKVTRSAMLQTRVTPGVKRAALEVLNRLGLTMTEAVEIFLRRLIVDQRLPFEVVAFDEETFQRVMSDPPVIELKPRTRDKRKRR
jgi:DNA-damage-inducible protein J